jgi:hypothetical protein
LKLVQRVPLIVVIALAGTGKSSFGLWVLGVELGEDEQQF